MTTRFRPTPYKDLHLGHAWVAWHCCRAARLHGGQFILIADDIAAQLQNTFVQSWGPTKAVARFREDLDWLGMAPDRVVYSSRNAEAHADAAQALGIRRPGQLAEGGIGALQIAAPGAGPHDAVAMYHPWLVAVRVVDDYECGINAFWRGADLLSEAQLYDATWRRLYGVNPPYQCYLPVVRREKEPEKESKSQLTGRVRDLRAAGYTPSEVIETLQECARRATVKGLRDVVIPSGVLDCDGERRTLRYKDDFGARLRRGVKEQAGKDWQSDVRQAAASWSREA